MVTHVLQPDSVLGRAIKKCPECRCRRRFVVRVYEWYAPTYTCGVCGYTFGAGLRYGSKAERERNRRWVAEQWPNVPHVKEAMRKLVDAMRENDPVD